MAARALGPGGELEELKRIGCSLQSTVFEFFEALKPRLSRNGKYDAKLDKAAEQMVDEFAVVTVSQLQQQDYQRWEKVLMTAELPTAWIQTFALILGTEIEQLAAVRPAGTPASAALATVESAESNDKKFGGKANLGKRLKACGQLDSVRLPETIFDAIYECPDYSRFAITYNDMKAVLTEIWKWVFCEFGVAAIDKDFARHIEKELVKRILSLPPGRKAWCPIIMTRFENGARKSAEVRCTPAANLESQTASAREHVPLSPRPSGPARSVPWARHMTRARPPCASVALRAPQSPLTPAPPPLAPIGLCRAPRPRSSPSTPTPPIVFVDTWGTGGAGLVNGRRRWCDADWLVCGPHWHALHTHPPTHPPTSTPVPGSPTARAP